MLTKDTGHIDWNRDSDEIERLVRALNPWPSAFTMFEGKILKIWAADSYGSTERGIEPGTIIEVEKESLVVSCGKGKLSISELQLEGKRRMTVKEFLPGYKVEAGMKLG